MDIVNQFPTVMKLHLVEIKLEVVDGSETGDIVIVEVRVLVSHQIVLVVVGVHYSEVLPRCEVQANGEQQKPPVLYFASKFQASNSAHGMRR